MLEKLVSVVNIVIVVTELALEDVLEVVPKDVKVLAAPLVAIVVKLVVIKDAVDNVQSLAVENVQDSVQDAEELAKMDVLLALEDVLHVLVPVQEVAKKLVQMVVKKLVKQVAAINALEKIWLQ